MHHFCDENIALFADFKALLHYHCTSKKKTKTRAFIRKNEKKKNYTGFIYVHKIWQILKRFS